MEFMLTAIRDAVEVLPSSDPVSDPVNRLLQHLGIGEELAAAALRERLTLKHKPTFRKNYLNRALAP